MSRLIETTPLNLFSHSRTSDFHFVQINFPCGLDKFFIKGLTVELVEKNEFLSFLYLDNVVLQPSKIKVIENSNFWDEKSFEDPYRKFLSSDNAYGPYGDWRRIFESASDLKLY